MALSYRVGSSSLYPWGRSTQFLKQCCHSCCPPDTGGLRWQGWRDAGPLSPAVWQEGEKNLISSNSKPNVLWKMLGLYPPLWKQGPFPWSWCQQEPKTHHCLKGKTWLPPPPCRFVPLGIWLLKHASKKKKVPIVCQMFKREISTIFCFCLISTWRSKPTLPSGEYVDPELVPQCTFSWCFGTTKPQTARCNP